MADVLLEAGADPNAATRGGFTPLMAAAQSADSGKVTRLLDAGADVDAFDEDHRTALHVAAWRAGPELIEILLEAGADPTIRNRWTQTAPEVAEARKANLEVDVTEGFQDLPAEWWPTSVEQIRLLTAADSAPPVLRITECERKGAADAHRLSVTVWILSAPSYGQAFDVFWRVEGELTRIGELVAEIGAVRSFTFEGHTTAAASDEVVLVLRPNPSLALARLQTWEISGGDVRLTAIAD